MATKNAAPTTDVIRFVNAEQLADGSLRITVPPQVQDVAGKLSSTGKSVIAVQVPNGTVGNFRFNLLAYRTVSKG